MYFIPDRDDEFAGHVVTLAFPPGRKRIEILSYCCGIGVPIEARDSQCHRAAVESGDHRLALVGKVERTFVKLAPKGSVWPKAAVGSLNPTAVRLRDVADTRWSRRAT